MKKQKPTPQKKPKPVIPMIVPTHDPKTHEAITDMMVHNSRHENARALDAEHGIQQRDKIHNTLDQTLEQHGRTHEAIKDNGASIDDMHEGLSDKLDEVSDKIVGAAKHPDIQKVSIVSGDDEDEEESTETPEEEDAEKKLSKMFFGMLRGKRGPKGDKGDKHTDEEIMAIIEPLLPKVAESIRPTEEDILSLIESVMPELKDGEDGKDGDDGVDGMDGESPSEEYLKKLISELIPSDEELTTLIKALIPKSKALKVPTLDEIITKLKGTIKYDDLIGKPNFDTFRPKGLGGTGYLREISDVAIEKITDGQSIIKKGDKFVPYTPTTGSAAFTYAEVPAGAIDGANTDFTLAHIPSNPAFILVILAGAIQSQLNGDFTVSGDTITLSSAPVAPATIEAWYS